MWMTLNSNSDRITDNGKKDLQLLVFCSVLPIMSMTIFISDQYHWILLSSSPGEIQPGVRRSGTENSNCFLLKGNDKVWTLFCWKPRVCIFEYSENVSPLLVKTMEAQWQGIVGLTQFYLGPTLGQTLKWQPTHSDILLGTKQWKQKTHKNPFLETFNQAIYRAALSHMCEYSKHPR